MKQEWKFGNHSYNHAHVNKLSLEQNIDDMKKCNELITNITGRDVRFYRGPYGEYNNTVIQAAKSLNMQVVQWDIDTATYILSTANICCDKPKIHFPKTEKNY